MPGCSVLRMDKLQPLRAGCFKVNQDMMFIEDPHVFLRYSYNIRNFDNIFFSGCCTVLSYDISPRELDVIVHSIYMFFLCSDFDPGVIHIPHPVSAILLFLMADSVAAMRSTTRNHSKAKSMQSSVLWLKESSKIWFELSVAIMLRTQEGRMVTFSVSASLLFTTANNCWPDDSL